MVVVKKKESFSLARARKSQKKFCFVLFFRLSNCCVSKKLVFSHQTTPNQKKQISLNFFSFLSSLFSLFSLSLLSSVCSSFPLLVLLLLLSRSRSRCRCRLEPRWSRRRRRRDRRIKEEHDGRSRRWRNPIDDDRRKEKERRGNDGVIYGRANESVPRAASISALARGGHRAVHALALALEDLDELPERALRERD